MYVSHSKYPSLFLSFSHYAWSVGFFVSKHHCLCCMHTSPWMAEKPESSLNANTFTSRAKSWLCVKVSRHCVNAECLKNPSDVKQSFIKSGHWSLYNFYAFFFISLLQITQVKMWWQIIIIHSFYIIMLFSALEQTHCAHVTCDSKWVTVSFFFIARIINIHVSGVLRAFFGCCMADATWNCYCLGASSVYTIQPCTSLQCHFNQSHIGKM